MASTYPGSLDAFTTIASDKKTSDSVGGRTHRDMHNDLGDAVEAVQAELGTDPAGSYSTVKARLDALVAYAAKTSAYTATVADHTLNVTSGTFTLDLPAASTCTGQALCVKNSGTGVVTLDGNSSETVEGVATFPLGPGSYVEITSTGSAWIVTAGLPDTGWRDVSASLLNGWTATSALLLRRVGGVVEFSTAGRINEASATSDDFYTVATGFRWKTSMWVSGISDSGLVQVFASGSNTLTSSRVAIDGVLRFSLTWTTTDAWPTSLPGSAA